MNKTSSPYIYSKLKGLAYELFSLECAKQNLQFRLEQIEDMIAQTECEVRFFHPCYEHEILDLDSLVMLLTPTECSVYTQDQFEKIEGTLRDE